MKVEVDHQKQEKMTDHLLSLPESLQHRILSFAGGTSFDLGVLKRICKHYRQLVEDFAFDCLQIIGGNRFVVNKNDRRYDRYVYYDCHLHVLLYCFWGGSRTAMMMIIVIQDVSKLMYYVVERMATFNGKRNGSVISYFVRCWIIEEMPNVFVDTALFMYLVQR